MGAISLILHAHLPAVAGTEGEVWFHEAMLGSYLPLTRMLREAESSGRLTLSVSPPLIDMLGDRELLDRFRDDYLPAHRELVGRMCAGRDVELAARHLLERAEEALETFDEADGDLLTAWRSLRDAGRIELGTCAGRHAILPLLHTTDFQRMHVEHAQQRFGETFGGIARFMWLPECGYAPGVDEILSEAGVWATVLEARALGEAQPEPVRGKYAPVMTSNLAVFARDPASGSLVWSRDTGYPGDAVYREFHRDAAWDLPVEQVRAFVRNGERIGSAVKLWSVSGRGVELGDKTPWNPAAAYERVEEHAAHFLNTVADELERAEAELDGTAHLCCPFDAELFGHWWYEGPAFLQAVMEGAAARGVDLITPSDYLAAGPSLQLASPATSTWGANTDFSWWVDESTSWILPLLRTAEERWLDARRRHGMTPELAEAARELMQAQASDWPFAIRGVRHAEFARDQIARHVIAFDRLVK